jgi:putative ABC transport system permease protein
MFLDYLRLAFKSLGSRKTRTYLTMIGIFIGIAAVVSLIGLGEGLRTAITSQFGFLGTDILSVQAKGGGFGPPGAGVPNPLDKKIVEKLDKINNVEAAFARYIESARVEYNDIQEIGMLVSIPGGDNRKIFEKMANMKADKGRLLRDSDNKKILLGSDYGKEDNVFEKNIEIGTNIEIEGSTYEVVGILEKKGSFVFDGVIFINEEPLLNNIKEDDDSVDVIAVKVKDQNQIKKTQENVEKILRKERDVDEGEEDFEVQTPQAALDQLNSTLFAVQLFVTIIAMISLVVGGIGIMNTMYTTVLERKKEIGIMKSIGARNSTIFVLFSIESGLLGAIGGIIGVLLGMSFAYGLAFLGKMALGSDLIQANISLTLIFGALAFSFILGTFFGVLPAYQASKLNPIDSLRSAK